MSYFQQSSARLIYRRLTAADIEPWRTFFENNPSLSYLGMDLTKSKDELARDWVLRQIQRYEELGFGHLGVIRKQDGAFIGMGGIIPREVDGREEHEIAYSLIPSYWGMGYATEIARTMRSYGEANINCNRFISIIDKRNSASARVAAKNGMSVLFETNYLGMSVDIWCFEHLVS